MQSVLEVKNNIPELYTVKVSAASFLPARRDNTHLNITLRTRLNGMGVGPLRGGSDDGDWKWATAFVLRVFANPAPDASLPIPLAAKASLCPCKWTNQTRGANR